MTVCGRERRLHEFNNNKIIYVTTVHVVQCTLYITFVFWCVYICYNMYNIIIMIIHMQTKSHNEFVNFDCLSTCKIVAFSTEIDKRASATNMSLCLFYKLIKCKPKTEIILLLFVCFVLVNDCISCISLRIAEFSLFLFSFFRLC